VRRIKIPIAATVSALALLALGGAGSASAATVLCAEAETPCAKANTAPSGTGFGWKVYPKELAGTSFSVKPSSGMTIKCTNVYVVSHTTAISGEPLPGAVEGSNSWIKECGNTPFGFECTAATMNAPPVSITATGSGNGTVKIGNIFQPLVISTTCQAFNVPPYTCSWTGYAVPFQMTGGAEEMVAKEAALVTGEGTSPLCGEFKTTARLNVTARLLAPYGGFVSTS